VVPRLEEVVEIRTSGTGEMSHPLADCFRPTAKSPAIGNPARAASHSGEEA